MRRRITATLFVLALALTFTASTAQAAHHELIYTVYYTCIIGPQDPDSVVGEWIRDCDGNLSGWGWTPGTNCTTTVTTPGESCPIE